MSVVDNIYFHKTAAPSKSVAFLYIIPQTHKMQQRDIDYAYGVILPLNKGRLFWRT